MLSFKIGGIDRTSMVQSGSFQINDEVNSRSTASFDLFDSTGLNKPVVGESVEIFDGVTLIYGGTVDELPEERVLGTNSIKYLGVPIVDYHQIADRFLVAESYEDKTLAYIVEDIRSKYLDDDGITAGDIQTGATISKAVWNYVSASTCFDELSSLTGFQWRINADKTLDFFDRATFIGTAINESSELRDVSVKKTREKYRNKQILRAGNDISAVENRSFKGDGETTVFTVGLPIALVPTIKVNTVIKTVGIRSVDTGKDFYWSANTNTITQDSSGTKLTDSDVLSVDYQGYFPIMIESTNEEEITARKAIEGGTGIYESAEEKTTIDTRAAALEYTAGLLRRYAQIETTLSFNTFTKYTAGQLVQVDLPTHNISQQMLVSTVNISDPRAYDRRVNYQVKLVSGESFGGWVTFFKKLVESSTSFTIRENEVLIKLSVFKDTFQNLEAVDSIEYTLHEYLMCGHLYAGGFYI